MYKAQIESALAQRFPAEVTRHIVDSFHEVERNFRLEKWKTSELDAGHFVEAVRRLLESELLGGFTPFSTPLGSFNTAVLSKLESATGPEEFRILIPRVLFAMYCVRNKRGVGHIGAISPNRLDATFILQSAKWVLGELVRSASSSSPDVAQALVDQIIYRQVDVVWDDGETYMVLDNKLTASEKILVVLYQQDRLTMESLQQRVDYKNKTAFRRLVEKLHAQKLLALAPGGLCKLSPLGYKEVERRLGEK